jgi:hypothetical protein
MGAAIFKLGHSLGHHHAPEHEHGLARSDPLGEARHVGQPNDRRSGASEFWRGPAI